MTFKARLITAMVVMLAVAMAGVVTYITSRNADDSRTAGFAYADEVTRRNAAEVQQLILGGLSTARDMSKMLQAASAGGASRQLAGDQLREVLTVNPSFLGIWTGWEPNAFDNRDAAYRNTGAGHDATGRFVPRYFRAGDRIGLTALTGYDQAGPGDYYQIPMTSGAEKVIEPYISDVAGVDTLITSVSVPIERGGTAVGVTGIDMSLDSLQKLVGEIRPFGTGHAVLVSTAGTVVAGGNGEKVGQPADGQITLLASEAAKAGTSARHVASTSGEEALKVAAPVRLGASDTWTLVVYVPTSTVLADAYTTRDLGLLITVIAVLLGALLAFLVARSIARPIERVRDRITEIADGDPDLTQRVAIAGRNDEAAQLAAAFNRFVEKVDDRSRGVPAATARDFHLVSAQNLSSASPRVEVLTTSGAPGTPPGPN